MNKAVLVIEMPECCLNCPCSFISSVVGTSACEIIDRLLTEKQIKQKKPRWCPLKPLPPYLMKTIAKYIDGTEKEITSKDYAKGWNACLDEITGGEE